MNPDLRCAMVRDCAEAPAYIDRKGWVYCAKHGPQRPGARKLTKKEIATLNQGRPLARF